MKHSLNVCFFSSNKIFFLEAVRHEYKKTSQDTPQSKSNKTISSTSTSKAVKRSGDGNLPVGKRRKQANIFNMMLSQTSKPKNKSRNCPICQKNLGGLNNTEINTHIDTCVIE